MNKVTLQISLAPSDYKHAIHLLPHQIKIFYNQVDEILLTYDTHKSKGRFGLNWEQNNKLLWDYITEFASDKEKIRVIKIKKRLSLSSSDKLYTQRQTDQ